MGHRQQRSARRGPVSGVSSRTGLRGGGGLLGGRGLFGSRGGSGVLCLGRFGALAGPRLVELDAPLALFALLQRQAGAEALARAPLEAGDRALGATGLDQLAGNRDRELLAGL